jgi:modulator of FtsH protease
MAEYDPARWSEFALAHLGASAALLGLVFVALSINLRAIVGSTTLVNRANETVIILASVLVSATVVLIPAQDRDVVSVELFVIAIATFSIAWRLQRGALADDPGNEGRGPSRAQFEVRRALSLGTAVLLTVAAITLSLEIGGGLYWWPVAIVAAYVSALANAWVLLIEILR